LSWANRLIEKKKLPTLFITLSCAELFWEDIKRLMQDRINFLPANQAVKLDTKSDVMKCIRDYSIVVQEFFIIKVKHWMENYAMEIFGIDHYFIRFEFADGRGEIHAHTIASANNMHVYELAYDNRHDERRKIQIFDDYATNVLGLTATHPATLSDGSLPLDRVIEPEGSLSKSQVYSSNYCPCSKRYNTVVNLTHDLEKLVNAVQTHKCGKYCLKKRVNGQRYCRAGCGKEMTEGECNTPGFKHTSNSNITRELNGTYKLCLKRNSSRMVQTSTYLLSVWRANCDLQLLLYQSDPRNPDLVEISAVTEYVVSYACKAHSKTTQEVDVLNSLILG
jgi:hypothetical protein